MRHEQNPPNCFDPPPPVTVFKNVPKQNVTPPLTIQQNVQACNTITPPNPQIVYTKIQLFLFQKNSHFITFIKNVWQWGMKNFHPPSVSEKKSNVYQWGMKTNSPPTSMSENNAPPPWITKNPPLPIISDPSLCHQTC